MPKDLQIHQTRLEQAAVNEVTIQDRIEFGTAQIDKLTGKNLRFSIRPAKISIRDVKVALNISSSVDWAIDVQVYKDSGTVKFPSLSWSGKLPDHDIPDITPTDALAFEVDEMHAEDLAATLDPIIGSGVGPLVARTLAEGIVAGKIVLPTSGFTLSGLGVGSMTLKDLAVPGLHIDQATLAKVTSAGVPIPRMTLSNIELQETGPVDMETAGTEFTYELASISPKVIGGPISLTLRASGKVKVSIGKVRLDNVFLSGAFGSLVLQELEVPFTARGIRLSSIDLGGVSVAEVALADAEP